MTGVVVVVGLFFDDDGVPVQQGAVNGAHGTAIRAMTTVGRSRKLTVTVSPEGTRLGRSEKTETAASVLKCRPEARSDAPRFVSPSRA